MLLFVVQLFGCASFTNGKKPSMPQDNHASLPSLSLHSTPILLGSSLLVGKSHTSDGSDRVVDGKPRFSGVMGAQSLTYKGYQYVIYYTAKDRGGYGDLFAEVVVARRKVTGHDWQHATLPVYRLTSDDAHNRQAIEISKGDGAIHISFDHHNSDRINYARTAAGVADHPETVDWNDDIFKFKRNLGFSNDAVSRVTYPKFYSLYSGNVLMYFREGGAAKGEMRLALYDAKSSDWESIRNLSSNDGVYLQNVNGNEKPSTRGPYLAGGGPKFDANGRILLYTYGANRDPKYFKNPLEFSLERDDEPLPVTLAYGPHHCTGDFLVKHFLEMIINSLLDRFDNFEITKEPELLPAMFGSTTVYKDLEFKFS